MKLSDIDTDHVPAPKEHRRATGQLRVTNDDKFQVRFVPRDTPLGDNTDAYLKSDTTMAVNR